MGGLVISVLFLLCFTLFVLCFFIVSFMYIHSHLFLSVLNEGQMPQSGT